MNKDLPKILQYSNRVILWGCEDYNDQLFASIGFFNRGLTAKIITLSDRQGNKILKAELPQDFKNQSRRGRSQNIFLKVVKRF